MPVERVESGIRERLAGMKRGDPLPPVRDLASQYGTSTATVAKALKRLGSAVITRPGWGVFKA